MKKLLPLFLIIVNCGWNASAQDSDAITIFRKPKSLQIQYINQRGKIVLTTSKENLPVEGMILLLSKDFKFGFANLRGETVVDPQYQIARDFSEGLAAIQDANSKWGYINKQGKLVIPGQYRMALDFEEGIGFVMKDNLILGVNPDGKVVVSTSVENDYFYFVPVDKGRFFIVATGSYYDEDLGNVMPKGWKIVDKNNNTVYQAGEMDFPSIKKIPNGFIVKLDYQYFVTDKDLKKIRDLDWQDDIEMGAHQSVFPVMVNNKWGLASNDKILLAPVYDAIYHFREGLARVKQGKQYGFIDLNGNLVIQPRFEVVYDFSDGLAGVKVGNKFGFVDRTGNIAIQPEYDKVYSFIGGKAQVYKGDQTFLIDRNGNKFWEPNIYKNGLQATYFKQTTFTHKIITRTDPVINFEWGTGSPDPKVPENLFCVEWLGFIQPEFTEEYTLYLVSDDGSRLWINDEQIIENWKRQAATEVSGTIKMEAGKKYPVKIRYYEGSGAATVKLLWSSKSQPKTIIPETNLFSLIE